MRPNYMISPTYDIFLLNKLKYFLATDHSYLILCPTGGFLDVLQNNIFFYSFMVKRLN